MRPLKNWGTPRMGRRSGLVVFVVLTALQGCDALLVDPAPDGPAPGIQFVFGDAQASATTRSSDPAEVLAQVNEVQFRFIRGDVVRDTTVRGRFENGELQVRVRLHPDEANGWLEVESVLLSRRRPLFEGHTILQAYRAGPTNRIEVHPVPGSVTVQPNLTAVTALGDTVDFEAVVRFHSGERIDGMQVEWESENSEVIEMIPGSRGVPRGNGVVLIRANAGDVSGGTEITVSQTPVRFTGVAPADTTISVGESFQLRPFGEDRNGFPLLPGAGVDWVSTGSVAVDEWGLVTGSTSGSANIDANFESSTYTTRVTVVSP